MMTMMMALAIAATSYNPHAKFDLKVSEVELHRNQAGRILLPKRSRFRILLDPNVGTKIVLGRIVQDSRRRREYKAIPRRRLAVRIERVRGID